MICKGTLKLIDSNSGKVILEQHNRFVTSGLAKVAEILNGESTEVPSHIAVGTSNTALADSQTALQGSELSRQAFFSHTRTGNSIELISGFPAGVGSGIWEEAGIFNAASGGTMFSRALLGTYTKKELDSIEIHWTYKFIDDGVD